MTFSVVARCDRTGRLGVAVSTAVPAVGAICPFVRARVGAIATQSWVNPYLGVDGLTLLTEGRDAQAALDRLVADDPGAPVRQLAIVDAAGRVAQFTGPDCTGWFGHRAGDGFGCQGNMLTGPEVIDAMVASMEASPDADLAERLVAALEAGQAAGGDKRGRQSASVTVHDTEAYAWLDLRVDEHADPVTELRRVFTVAQRQLIPFVDGMPTRNRPLGRLAADASAMLLRSPAER